MVAPQRVGDARGADERQHVHPARTHQRADDRRPVAVDRADDARREGGAEGVEQRPPEQRAEARRLDDGAVPHDQRRDQRRERFVERVVVRPHREDHAERRAADLRQHPLLDDEAGGRAVEFLHRVDRVAHVLRRAVELLARVGERLADLPREEPHDLVPPLLHPEQELLDAADPLRDRHRRPRAAAAVEGARRGVERRQRRLLVHRREAPDERLLQRPAPPHADRRAGLLERPLPRAEFPADEPLPLLDRPGEPGVRGNLVLGRKEGAPVAAFGRHVVSLTFPASARGTCRSTNRPSRRPSPACPRR